MPAAVDTQLGVPADSDSGACSHLACWFGECTVVDELCCVAAHFGRSWVVGTCVSDAVGSVVVFARIVVVFDAVGKPCVSGSHFVADVVADTFWKGDSNCHNCSILFLSRCTVHLFRALTHNLDMYSTLACGSRRLIRRRRNILINTCQIKPKRQASYR